MSIVRKASLVELGKLGWISLAVNVVLFALLAAGLVLAQMMR